MKAVLVTKFGGPEVLEYKSIDIPTIGPTQVLIRVAAASINFADIKARLGKYHGAGNPPFIPGLDVAGTIESIGSEVTHLNVGQRVIAFPDSGSYTEYTVADQILTFPIPDTIDFDTAAACPLVSFTSYNLLAEVARLQKGESVLIHAAAGGIGTTAIQLAKLLGAKTVIGTVGSDAKVDIVRQAGADFVLNYESEHFVEEVLELTNAEGANVILDSLAGEIFEKSLECLSRFGRIVNFGNATQHTGKFHTNGLHASCRSVLGYSFGTTRKYHPERVKHTAEAVIPYLANGQLEMIINKRFKLVEAGQAHEWIESRKSTGKILLQP
jgi:NADPH2:quinone reductase